MKVTDLEEFAEADIMRPYWPMHPDHEKPEGREFETYREMLRRTGQRRYSPMRVAEELRAHKDTAWFRAVIDRLGRIGDTFPSYIVHTLVFDIRDYLEEWRHGRNDSA